VELAALSLYSYESDCSKIKDLLKTSFHPSMNATMLHCQKYESVPRAVVFSFSHDKANLINDKRNGRTIVIAVKGTSTTSDAFLDTSLYGAVKILQLFNNFLPILTLIPLGEIQYLLQITDMMASTESRPWHSLENQVKLYKKKYSNHTVFLTGHSLGGGIAQIVASRTQIPAVVFSAPGVVYSASKFGMHMQECRRKVWVVMPDQDVVPRVDLQAGTVQQILCRDPNGEAEYAWLCHSIQRTACEIFRMCGDRWKRDFTGGCNDYIDQTELGKDFPSDVIDLP